MKNKTIIKKILTHTTAFAVLALVFVVPMFLFAQATPAQASSSGLIVCDGGASDPCTFSDVMDFINKVLNFIVYKLMTPLFVVMLMWQGFKLITSAINPKAASLSELKSNIMKIIVGYLWVLGAWLIVKTVVVILAGKNPSFDVFFN